MYFHFDSFRFDSILCRFFLLLGSFFRTEYRCCKHAVYKQKWICSFFEFAKRAHTHTHTHATSDMCLEWIALGNLYQASVAHSCRVHIALYIGHIEQSQHSVQRRATISKNTLANAINSKKKSKCHKHTHIHLLNFTFTLIAHTHTNDHKNTNIMDQIDVQLQQQREN